MPRLVYGWLTALVSSLPLWLGYRVADALTEAHFRLFPARRHAALVNLAVILPRATRRERLAIVRNMMRSYNRMMFEFFRLPHLTRDELLHAIDVVGREHLEQAVARGRGVVITSTHVGNWELAAVVLAQRTGALIICGFCERIKPGRFRIVLEPALDPATFADTTALVTAVASTSERHIREHLNQWCIFRPLWEAAPDPGVEPARAARSVLA